MYYTFKELKRKEDDYRRSWLLNLLATTNGNVTQAAKLAEMNRSNFYRLLRRHVDNKQTVELIEE